MYKGNPELLEDSSGVSFVSWEATVIMGRSEIYFTPIPVLSQVYTIAYFVKFQIFRFASKLGTGLLSLF